MAFSFKCRSISNRDQRPTLRSSRVYAQRNCQGLADTVSTPAHTTPSHPGIQRRFMQSYKAAWTPVCWKKRRRWRQRWRWQGIVSTVNLSSSTSGSFRSDLELRRDIFGGLHLSYYCTGVVFFRFEEMKRVACCACLVLVSTRRRYGRGAMVGNVWAHLSLTDGASQLRICPIYSESHTWYRYVVYYVVGCFTIARPWYCYRIAML